MVVELAAQAGEVQRLHGVRPGLEPGLERAEDRKRPAFDPDGDPGTESRGDEQRRKRDERSER